MIFHQLFRSGSRIPVLATAALALTVASVPVTTLASDTFSESTSAKSRGAGDDENITDDTKANNPDAEMATPPDKGGEAARAGCKIKVDNWTPWKIQVFVNGVYRGLIQSWGDGRGYYGGARHTLYGVADFTDGSRRTWGPSAFNCRGSYTWKLNR